MSTSSDSAAKAPRKPVRRWLWITLLIMAIGGGALQIGVGLTGSTVDPSGEWSPPPPPPGAVIAPDRWEPAFDDLRPARHLPWWLSAFNAWGLGMTIPAGMAAYLLVAWMRGRIRAWRGRRATRRTEALTEHDLGEQVIRGRIVAVAGDTEHAVGWVVEQQAVQKKGLVEWNQTSRRKSAVPFDMELAGGDKVHVEPGDDPRFAEPLDETEQTGPTQRERRVRLSLGDQIFVTGTLARGADPSGGYRGGRERFVMVPPSAGPMGLSTQSPHLRFDKRARTARTLAIIFVAYVLIFGWFLHFSYWITSVKGSVVPAAVVQTGMRVSQSKNSAMNRTKVPFIAARTLAGGHLIKSEVTYGASKRLEVGSRIPVVFHPKWREHGQVGSRPTEENVELMANAMTLGLLFVVFWVAWSKRLPYWHERRGLTEYESGTLRSWPPEPPAGV